MKKLVVLSAMIFGVLFISGNVNAQAAQSSDKDAKTLSDQTTPKPAGNFKDKNSDGICDNHQTRACREKCTGFVDANSDGICDCCKGKENCCQGKGSCCKDSGRKGNCTGMKPGCCGQGQHHRHGCNTTKQQAIPEPEKK